MFVDASAIVAIIVSESDADDLGTRLAEAEQFYTSALACYEATLGVARVLNLTVDVALSLVDDFAAEADAEITPITAEIGREAVRAFARFGRGRHPAALNMGDCFAYACARTLGVPLLYKGDDFALTDIAAG